MSDLARPTNAVGSLHPLARIYAISTLDPVIEVARIVAHSVSATPQRFPAIPRDIGGILESLRTHVGTDPQWPNSTQRNTLYVPLVGFSFQHVCAALRAAAFILIDPPGSSNKALRSAFLEGLATASAHLKTLDGQNLADALRQVEPMFASAAKVFQTEAVAATFGLAPASNTWPFAETADGTAAALVEAISGAAGTSSGPQISRHRFLLLQRAAFHGAQTINRLLKVDTTNQERGNLDDVIDSAYLWEKTLQNLLFGIDVRRAWVDTAFRESLSLTEQSVVPAHPSGQIESGEVTAVSPALIGVRPITFSTFTTRTICCSTGDLICPRSGGSVAIGFY
jgi:mersacidin/lichenicidin family type 2 lantibiotic